MFAVRYKRTGGFTLIELLVVIAIIGVLAGIVVTSLNSARAKSRDARRKADLKQLYTALNLYYNQTGGFPINRNPCCGYPDTSPNFLQELVDQGFLARNPKSPTSDRPYYYYNYGAGNNIGAIVVVDLETISPTTVGPDGSCRPFTDNWCSYTNPNTYYCLCIPH